MHIFSTTFLEHHKFTLLFIVIWSHASILDLFYFTYNGSVFLWEKNSQLLTLRVHMAIGFASMGLYQILFNAQVKKFQKLSEE